MDWGAITWWSTKTISMPTTSNTLFRTNVSFMEMAWVKTLEPNLYFLLHKEESIFFYAFS
jgi:hypothetical protein